MASIQCYLMELDKQRDKLANILVEKGIEADESETYNALVEKVSSIETASIKAYANSYLLANGAIGIAGNAEMES